MTRIKIDDIPEGKKISREELRAIMGGGISPSGMFEVGQISMPGSQVTIGLGGARDDPAGHREHAPQVKAVRFQEQPSSRREELEYEQDYSH